MVGFGNVNKNLESYLKKLMSTEEFDLEKYGSFIHKVYKYASKIMDAGNEKLSFLNAENEESFPTKKITKEQSLQYVREFLNEIDSSFAIEFEKALENSVFHFTDKSMLEEKEESEDNFYYYHSLAGVIEGEYFTNIVMTYTISDAFLIIHEFMHYLNLFNLEQMTSGWALFTEGYSNFFEVLFLQYCLKNEALKEDAICYFDTLLYSIICRTNQFITQYFVFDVYLCHGKIDYKKLYKYCSSYEDSVDLFYCILQMIQEVDEYFATSNPKLSEYLDDARYVIGIPFTLELLENYENRKEEILSDYMILNRTNMDYYLEKYELDKHKVYDKLFCLNR